MDVMVNDSVLCYMHVYTFMVEKKNHYLVMGTPKRSDNRKAWVEEHHAVPKSRRFTYTVVGAEAVTGMINVLSHRQRAEIRQPYILMNITIVVVTIIINSAVCVCCFRFSNLPSPIFSEPRLTAR